MKFSPPFSRRLLFHNVQNSGKITGTKILINLEAGICKIGHDMPTISNNSTSIDCKTLYLQSL